MFSWFRKKTPKPKVTISKGLAALAQHGISKRPEITMEDILYSTGGTLENAVDYMDLLYVLGGEGERRVRAIMSDDIWHFDTECIVEDGDYIAIAERLQRLSKGALEISALVDHVSYEDSEAWLEFDFQDKRIHWDLEHDNDWVDATVFTRFVKLFASVPSQARSTYGNLGGQDCMIGFATDEQRQALSTLTGLKFEWLT